MTSYSTPQTGRICKVQSAPRGGRWTMKLDGAVSPPIADILAWAAKSVRGRMFWSETRFRNPNHQNHRWGSAPFQRHFKDETPHYQFWFTKRSDAALFKLMWTLQHGR